MSHIVRTISERKPKKHIEYRREFQLIGADKGTGFSFPCDISGNINIKDENYPHWKENYEYCIAHPEEYEDLGKMKLEWDYVSPATVECSCGEEFALEATCSDVCSCPGCGQWYNLFGQALVNPEFWEQDDEYVYDEMF